MSGVLQSRELSFAGVSPTWPLCVIDVLPVPVQPWVVAVLGGAEVGHGGRAAEADRRTVTGC